MRMIDLKNPNCVLTRVAPAWDVNFDEVLVLGCDQLCIVQI